MAKIDPKDLEVMEKQGVEIKKDTLGNVLAYKGPWLPDWYDDRMEMMRDNQKELNRQKCAKLGLNEHGQTKEQQESFKKRKAVSEEKKRKAEIAAEMAIQSK